MNKRESMDVESAYGSEFSSNSGFLSKGKTFKMEEPTSKNQNWHQWLRKKIRKYMILEAVSFLILVFLLITCYRTTSQNQAMILSLQSQFTTFQKQTKEKDFKDSKENTEETTKNENERMKGMLEEVLKEVRIKSTVQAEASRLVLNSTASSEKTNSSPSIPTINFNSTLTRFNAASLIAGAIIKTSQSSSSSLNPFFGFDQSEMVLVDRSEPPVNKAWCTYEKEPVLTVNLAKYVKPTAVSYQHSKWNGIIPDDTPKVYDVIACLDYYCEIWEPIISDCHYNPYGCQEQICSVPSNSSVSPIGKVQFRFRKNHGNTDRTCVSLVRVYAETEEVPEKKLRSLEDTKTCSDLKHDYHNNPRIYHYFDFKNCTLLYSKDCCIECPECCEECEIQDTNLDVIGLTILIIIASPIYAIGVLMVLAVIFGVSFLILWGLYALFKTIFIFFKGLCFP